VISFSSTDYVGHKYGPDAEEVKSMYLNLDQQIADLIQFLETHCGSKEFIISLTSDHGAGTSPVEIERKRLKGGNFVSKEIFPELNSQLELKFGVPNILARYSNMQFYINYQKLDSLNISKKEVFEEARNWLKKQSSVDEVYSLNTLSNSIGTLKIKSLINGIYPNRSGDIFLTLKPGYIEWSTKTGTTHGTHYNYDSHVPLLFYGYNIQPKQIYRNIKIIDIAPTLSILLRSAFPNACTGNPISEVFQN
jgi:predicted AlkP superfamily pyrophosphatase or phosphodiesterase